MMFLLLFLLGQVHAQDLAALFRPGPSGHTALIRQQFYGNAQVPGSNRRLQHREWQGRVNGTLWSNDSWEMTGGIDAQDLVWHHPSPVLNPYRNFQGTVGARRFSGQNQVRGFNLSYGSASDRPFARAANDTASANYVHQFNERWWGLVNWSNNRLFLNNVPLPGVFYVSKMTREETLMFGFPAIFWRKRWQSGFEGMYFSFLPYNHRAYVGWFWNADHGVLLSYTHAPQVFFRDERVSKRERVFFIENKAMIEIQGTIIPRHLQWQVGVGTAFNRRVYEAKNFQEDKRFDVPLGDTWLASAQLTAQF